MADFFPLIDRALIKSSDGAVKALAVENPATGAEITRVKICPLESIDEKIADAEKAFADWSARTAKDRAHHLNR